jgi:hypothetical protein
MASVLVAVTEPGATFSMTRSAPTLPTLMPPAGLRPAGPKPKFTL